MKTLRFIAVTFAFAAVLAVSAFAQTSPASSGKIGLINTLAFDSKDGITKYVNAMNALENEFKPDNTALQTMQTKIRTLQTEIQTIRKQIEDNKVPVDEKTVNAKLEEYDKLTREYKFKEDDAKARFQRREQAVMNPIRQDIGKALQEYAAQKGYSLILDIAKLAEANIVLAVDEKILVTQDFIKFYNSRPATAATTAAK